MLDLAAAFLALTTFFTYINYRFIKLPPTIGVMLTALVLSLIALGCSALGYPVLETEMQHIVSRIDFSDVLMTWFLPALLFAGALHVNLDDLRSYKWPIGILATGGVLISTFVVAWLAFHICGWFGWHLDFIYCLLFGALISPTDPIAAMGVLKTSGAPKPLQTTIVGESLFNDGTAVVLFSILLDVLNLGQTPSLGDFGLLFAKEAVGGIVLGVVLGYGVFYLLRQVDEHQPSVMLTLALVFGGSALATHLHVSAPIVMAVAGLIIGNQGRSKAMTDSTRRYVDGFWEVIDEILNALLFALIGLELLILPFGWLHAVAALLLGGAVLLSRVLTVAPMIAALRKLHGVADRQITRGTVRILAWGGLRGGVSVALALSLPLGDERELLLSLTYIIVLVSIIVQGLTVGPLVRSLYGANPAAADGH
jgi:CPA1 family monovalent cation:H+ antiporter